jgi:pimeloyl-ACP methyl ester carboxylesterase
LPVIIGGDDPLRENYVEPLHKLRPDVPVQIIEGAGHLSCVGRPEFKEGITAFLATQSSKLPLK